MLHDIQTVLSRLVGKASQLLGNNTTNLAECWMHIRSKFDGGKVINHSQSGSWEHRCMGRGVARIFLKGVLSLVSLARPFLQLVRCIVLASLATLSAFSLET